MVARQLARRHETSRFLGSSKLSSFRASGQFHEVDWKEDVSIERLLGPSTEPAKYSRLLSSHHRGKFAGALRLSICIYIYIYIELIYI